MSRAKSDADASSIEIERRACVLLGFGQIPEGTFNQCRIRNPKQLVSIGVVLLRLLQRRLLSDAYLIRDRGTGSDTIERTRVAGVSLLITHSVRIVFEL